MSAAAERLDPSSYLTFDSRQIGGDSSLVGGDSSLLGRSDFNESNSFPTKLPQSQSKASRASSKVDSVYRKTQSDSREAMIKLIRDRVQSASSNP